MRIWTCGVCNQALAPGTATLPPLHDSGVTAGGGAIRSWRCAGRPVAGLRRAVSAAARSRRRVRASHRRRWLAAGIVGAVIAMLFGVVWATSGDEPSRLPRRATTTSPLDPTSTTGTTSTTEPPATTEPFTSSTLVPPSTGPSTSQPPSSGPSTGPTTVPTTNPTTVRELTERWNHRLGRMSRLGARNGSQVVVATRSGTVLSLDSRTGRVRWRRPIGEDRAERGGGEQRCGGRASPVRVVGDGRDRRHRRSHGQHPMEAGSDVLDQHLRPTRRGGRRPRVRQLTDAAGARHPDRPPSSGRAWLSRQATILPSTPPVG